MKRDLLNLGALVTTVLVLAIGGPWLARQVKSLPRQALVARAGQRIVTLEVVGMTSPDRAAAIQSSLAAIPGVAMAEVRLPQRRAYVVCDPAVADTALVAAVHRAGPGLLASLTAR
jgi:copper chaperone CopZ